MVNNILVGGWATPLKNDGVKVSWDDDIPHCFWKVIQNSMVPNHQPAYIYTTYIPVVGIGAIGSMPHVWGEAITPH